jgi:hypothetical protein
MFSIHQAAQRFSNSPDLRPAKDAQCVSTALKVLGLLVLSLSGGCGGSQVPSVDPTIPVTVYRGDRQPAPACPTLQEASSPEQFRDLAQRAVDRMETCRSGVARNLQRTRDTRDIVAVLCISDKLSRFDALLLT